jgi:starvation-inducible outer membrane lipoprotein
VGIKAAVGVGALALALTGCASAPPPAKSQQPARPMTKCEAVAALLSNQWATQGQIQAAMEVGRNNGCFGAAQPQTLQIR